MGGNDKDGYYCTICGGIPPDKINIKRILVDGKETGIDQLDWIIAEVRKLNLSDDTVIRDCSSGRRHSTTFPPKRQEYGEA